VTLLYNQGELLIHEHQYAEAREVLRRGASFCSRTTPLHLQTLIAAGIGLCSLELGDLAAAREQDALVGSLPNAFYYDPTTAFHFRVRLLLRRGQGALVLEELEAAASAVRGRLPLAWLKLTLLVGDLRSRLKKPPPPWLPDAITVAAHLPSYQRLDALLKHRRP
jgi:hypothetical protein